MQASKGAGLSRGCLSAQAQLNPKDKPRVAASLGLTPCCGFPSAGVALPRAEEGRALSPDGRGTSARSGQTLRFYSSLNWVMLWFCSEGFKVVCIDSKDLTC